MHHSSHEEAPRIRPSLPRLKNKASIGRLIAYGGVLDFEGSSITPSTSTSTPSSNTTHLAGPASSSPPSPLPPINNTIMHSSTGKQDQEALLRTPTKNTSQATLRALKQFNNKYGVNTSIHTPSNDGVAPPPPSAILALDLDQHWTQTGCGLKSEQSQQQLQNAQSSSVPCSSLDGPASTSGVKNDSVKEGYVISSRSKNTITEDEERLAREIREDMDDGGYASLEQILARNGFQVCRIQTPPSTEKRPSASSSSLNKPSILESIASISSSSIHTSSSNRPVDVSSSSSIIASFNPLSRITSKSSSLSTETNTTTRGTALAQQEATSHRQVKNKSSMLSFSGIVSTLWGTSPTPSAAYNDATIISSPHATRPQVVSTSHDDNPPSPHNTTISDTPGNDSLDTTGRSSNINGTRRLDKNEEMIKGWLRQTVEATNTYMNEAKNAIEAARMAMGSPERKKKVVAQAQVLPAQHGMVKDALDAQEEGEGDNDDLPLGHERRQGTQSTLESTLIETPTASPTTLVHAVTSTSSMTGDNVNIKADPPYSPPLGQTQIGRVVDAEAYFDSPLVGRRKMKHHQQQQEEIVKRPGACGEEAGDVQGDEYPPSPGWNATGATQGEENRSSSRKQVSAEALLRGTLRHALSESGLARQEKVHDMLKMSPPGAAVPVAAPKNGYRPSITTIFGIPMPFSSSLSSSSSITSPARSADANEEEKERSKLKDSTTESLSTDAPSTSTSTTNNTNKTQSTNSNPSNSDSIKSSTATGPRLLRKTASKHTLRKAASPVLSASNAAIVVLRDEEEEGAVNQLDSPTPIKKTIPPYAPSTVMDATPVKNRQAPGAMRGPVPLKSLNSSAEREQQRKNGTPRQVAHRNPRDSPIGETRVVKNNHNAKKTPTSPLNVKRFPSGPPLALSSSSAELTKKAQGIQGKNKENDDTPVKKLNQKKGGIGSKPCIMDDENDIQGLWSPPRPRNGAISRPPLGETNRQIQNQADATLSTTTTGKGGIKTKEARPRLKAKESLERLLAYKQMQEDDSTASKKTEEIPPVPALPSQIRSSTAQHPNQEEVQQKKMNDQDIPLTQAAVNADILDNNVKSTPEDTRGKTVKIKASFTGTLRGIMNSAVSGWTESLPTSISDKNTPTAISHPLSITSSISNSSRRVTILPSTYSSQQQQRSFDSTTRQKSVRKSKSMYISSPHIDGNSRIGRRESKDGAGGGGRSSSWIAMERERNSLILPTIIISDYTHD